MIKKIKKSIFPKIKSLLKIKNISFAVLVLLVFIQYFQVRSIFGTTSSLEGRDTNLITEIGHLNESYVKMGQDLNEIRTFLRMPTKNYSITDETALVEKEKDKDTNTNELQLAMFKYVDFLSKNTSVQKNFDTNKAILATLHDNEAFKKTITTNKLSLSNPVDDETGYHFNVTLPENQVLLTYAVDPEDGLIYKHTPTEDIQLKYSADTDYAGIESKYVTETLESLKKQLSTLTALESNLNSALKSNEVVEVKKNLNITIDEQPLKDGKKLRYSIKNKSFDPIGEIILDKPALKVSLVDLKNKSNSLQVTEVSSSLVSFLKTLDISTLVEKKYKAAVKNVEDTLKDVGFKTLLKENKLTVVSPPREDDARTYFDVKDDSSNIISSIVIEKATGVVNIVKPDGTNSENILFFDPEFKKKNLVLPDIVPEYGEDTAHEDNTFNILIAGKNGNLVDTMIFAHIDNDRGDIRMISVPRDLFYNGRKINAYAYFYGMPELKKVLSKLTGYELDKYILIDMYSFIDVIDLLGGIDVHLDKAVIDPTYRTVDNGVEGTLHYEPGDYHLSGVQSLRLARSRHTTSDFARAERQQMILEALQSKAKNFGFGDADTIYEIARTVLSKTETDISLKEAISYYFKYQNYDIISNNVMSSGNVLYVPPYITKEKCNALVNVAKDAGAPTPSCINENHAYTLLPRDNNWNIVKWYFKKNFENEDAT